NGWVSVYVHDIAGNAAVNQIEVVNIDRVKPVITLNGAAVIMLYEGGSYDDAGAIVLDDIDGNITDQLVVTSNVDTYSAGDYTIRYEAVDRAGNMAEPVTRTVKVLEREEEEEEEEEDQADTKVVTKEGGAFELNGVIVRLPADAIHEPIRLRVTVVAELDQL